LVNDGLIYRERGRGTFVAPPKIDQSLNRIISFTEDMRQRGYKASTRLLFSGLVAASEEVAARLKIDPGDELACLERLRLADGVPLSIEVSNLVHRYCPGILKGDYVRTPLREALEREYDIRLARAEQMIRAISATPDLAKKLSIPPNSALLFIERISYSPMNVPIEFLRLYHRGDRYAMYNELFD
jgi:GntR family transcriptional regulator